MILITGTIEVLDRDRDAFLELAERQVRLSREEEGCLDYSCGEDTLRPGVFTFIERWKNQAAVDVHFSQAYCRDFISSAVLLAQNDVLIELLHADRVEQREIPKPA